LRSKHKVQKDHVLGTDWAQAKEATLEAKEEMLEPGKMQAALVQANAAIFIIAMPERKERMELLMKNQFKVSEDRTFFVPPVMKSTLPDLRVMANHGIISPEYMARMQDPSEKEYFLEHEAPTEGRTAVYLSHMEANRLLIDSTFDIGIILEDDISTIDVASGLALNSSATQTKLHSALTERTDAWSVLYLGYCYETCAPADPVIKLTSGTQMRKAVSPMCLHAYATKRDASQQFLQSGLPIHSPVDHQFQEVLSLHNVSQYILLPPLIWQAVGIGSLRGDPVEDESKPAFCDWEGCNSELKGCQYNPGR